MSGFCRHRQLPAKCFPGSQRLRSISSPLPQILGYITFVLTVFFFLFPDIPLSRSLPLVWSWFPETFFFLLWETYVSFWHPSPILSAHRGEELISFFFLNNAHTTCVNKLPLPFLRGPSVSFTALSFRMCLKNVIFILTPAGIFFCSIPHFCLRYCIWHQLYPLIFIIHCWTPYFMQNYVHFVIVINPIQSRDTL